MEDSAALLGRWELAAREVRERMYRTPTPRDRDRWHALWLCLLYTSPSPRDS